MYPGDPSGPAYLIYNCRCTIIAAVDGVDTSDAKRWARDPETDEEKLIEDMTYAEWAGWKEQSGMLYSFKVKDTSTGDTPTVFDIKEAKEKYSVLLKTVPERNKIYLQQAFEAVEYKERELKTAPFGYSEKDDAIYYDPGHPSFERMDFSVVNTHELAHRIDRFFVQSWKNESFSKAIKSSKEIIKSDPGKFAQYCERDNEGFLSDICGAICDSEVQFDFGHDSDYWKTPGNKEREIFANVFSLEAYGDTEKVKFISENFPELLKAYKALKYFV